MRMLTLTTIISLLLLESASAGLFGGDSSSDMSSSTPTSSSSTPTNSASSEVAFLQTLQAAQISSMSCLITLVNMTANPIGTCLGLPQLSQLIVNPNSNNGSSFSDELSGYLSSTCAATQCGDNDIMDAKGQLSGNCGGSQGTELIQVLNAVLDNYGSSYRTLACSVHFNGTAGLCLPSVLNTSATANSNNFFDPLVAGNSGELQGFQDSVFKQAQCTGCMYEMYKASVYMIPALRSQSLTTTFGDHLKTDCPNTAGSASVDWSNVEDQQIPDALQVQQNTAVPGGASSSGQRAIRAMSMVDMCDKVLGMGVVLVGGLGVGMIL